MNCKPGDLAVILYGGSYPENTGGLVRILGESPNGPHPKHGFQWSCETLHPLRSSWGVVAAGGDGAFPDKYLRPIRDSDGPDEMLALVGKPEEVTA